MEELITQVSKKAGIPEDKARQAVETVIGFLKEKLPAPVASQIDNVLKSGDIPDVGGMGKKLGGMLGKK